jgi:hypothetical protein
MTLKILAILMVVGVIVYSWYRNDLRRLTRDYACKGPFDGALERCIIRFPLDEASSDVVLGANSEGLYMSSFADALKKNRRWSFRYHVIRTPIFIPWHCIEVRDPKFPMVKHLRFDVPSNKATFFVPQEAAHRPPTEIVCWTAKSRSVAFNVELRNSTVPCRFGGTAAASEPGSQVLLFALTRA